MEKEARCRRGQGGHLGQAEEGARRDRDGHLGQQGPEDQAVQGLLPGGDQGEGEEARERQEGPVETTVFLESFTSSSNTCMLIERQHSADVTSLTHTVLSFRDRSFVPRDCFRRTGLHSSFARMFGE